MSHVFGNPNIKDMLISHKEMKLKRDEGWERLGMKDGKDGR